MKSASENVFALNQSGTPVPVRRFRHLPAEWIVALVFVAFGLWAYLQTPVSWVRAGVILHRHLALAFTASSHLMMMLAYSVTLLRYVPEAERRTWTRNAAFLASTITLACVLLLPTPQATPIGRLLESSMLGMVLTALTLTLFLPVAGLVSLRRVVGTIAETALLWGPYLIYFAFCGFALAALPVATLAVKDPTLMRMDLSLGFSASQIAYSWRYDAPWVYDVSSVAYRLLGLLVALVIARLQIARAWAHARRAIFVSFLVGFTGLTCYRIVPAIGPIFAYTPLHRQLHTPERQAEAEAALTAALEGPAEITVSRKYYRNAMPSLHTAFSLVALTAAWKWRRRFFWACLPLGFLQIATTLTLAYHYAVDLIAAVPLSVFCWWLADRGIRLTPRPGDEPLPAATPGRWLPVCLLVSVGTLLAWAALAPLSPWIAWPLATLAVVAPCYPTLARFCATRLPRKRPLTSPAPMEASPTSRPSPDSPPA